MDNQDEVRLIWWQVMDVAWICGQIGDAKFSELCSRIHDFQYDLWTICDVIGGPRPKGGVNVYPGRYT